MKPWKPCLIVVTFLLVLASAHAQTPPSPVPAAATALANRYLRSVERSWVIPPAAGEEPDCVMLGKDRSGSGDWRVLVLTGGARPKVAWDSRRLQLDGYFKGKGAETVTVRNARDGGYLIAMRGCAPHRCYDGVFGYAVYASGPRRAFTAQVTTLLLNRNAFDYSVTYDPPIGLPEQYRSALQGMICADPGISEPGKLRIKCPGR